MVNNNYSNNVFENYNNTNNSNADNKCSICYDKFTTTDPAIRTRCNHRFHLDCLRKWSSSGHNSCPLCRRGGVDQNVILFSKIDDLANKRQLATARHSKKLCLERLLSTFNLVKMNHGIYAGEKENRYKKMLEKVQKNINGVSYTVLTKQINNQIENVRTEMAIHGLINQTKAERNKAAAANDSKMASNTLNRNKLKAARENRNTKAAENYKRASEVKAAENYKRAQNMIYYGKMRRKQPVTRASAQAAARQADKRSQPSAQASTRPRQAAQLPLGRTRTASRRPAYRP